MVDKIKFREDIKDFVPYQPLKFKTQVKLDANESPFGLPDDVLARISEELRSFDFNRYPDPDGVALREAIAGQIGIDIDNIVLGNGGDEILLNSFIAFGGAGSKAVIFGPTFSVYKIYATLTRTSVVDIARNEKFEITKSEVDQAVKAKPDMVFLCNPNNPTGTATSFEVIEKLIENVNGFVLLDEAYGEFSDFSQLMMTRYPNVGVLKTFSKAYSLASLRVGYMVAQKNIINEFNKVRLPFNLSTLSMEIARICLENNGIFQERVELIKRERERVGSELRLIEGIKVFPSQANYIYFELSYNAEKVFNGLVGKGVLIRPFSRDRRLKDGLRVTIGSPEENNIFLSAISEVIKEL